MNSQSLLRNRSTEEREADLLLLVDIQQLARANRQGQGQKLTLADMTDQLNQQRRAWAIEAARRQGIEPPAVVDLSVAQVNQDVQDLRTRALAASGFGAHKLMRSHLRDVVDEMERVRSMRDQLEADILDVAAVDRAKLYGQWVRHGELLGKLRVEARELMMGLDFWKVLREGLRDPTPARDQEEILQKSLKRLRDTFSNPSLTIPATSARVEKMLEREIGKIQDATFGGASQKAVRIEVEMMPAEPEKESIDGRKERLGFLA